MAEDDESTENSYSFDFGTELDEDYIDVETDRADVSFTDDESRDEQERESDLPSAFDYSHEFDTSKGSGASERIDDIIDDAAIIENDGRSETRTFFRPDEASNNVEQYERMVQYQDGMWDSSRASKNKKADNDRWVDTFCSYLDVPDYQEERVQLVVESVNMSHMAHYSAQETILASISIVENERGRWIRDEDAFRDLILDVGTSLDSMKKARILLRDKSDQL